MISGFPPLDTKPMEAATVEELPSRPEWQYEPKYDGSRCLVFRRGEEVQLQSKKQKPLQRYFPELEAGLRSVAEDGFVIDGEIVIPGQSFEALQLRLHPAASRIAKLAQEQRARIVVFDLLARHGEAMLDQPLSARRAELEDFMSSGGQSPVLDLGKVISSAEAARDWLGREGLDGLVEATRPPLPARATGNAEVQAVEDRRLRDRGTLLQARNPHGGAPSPGAL